MAENNDIYSVLRRLEGGELAADMERALRDLMAQLSDHAAERGGRAKGSLTLKIGFDLKDGVVTVCNSLATVAPKPIRRDTVMWLTPDNSLTTQNPRQQELPLVDVNKRAEPARTA